MKRSLITFLLFLLFPTWAFASGIQERHKQVLARKNACTWSDTWTDPSYTTSDVARSADTNWRIVIASGDISTSGSKIKVHFEDDDNRTVAITRASICQQDSGSTCTASPTQITFDGGSAGFSIAAGAGDKASDEITYTINASNTYLVTVWLDYVADDFYVPYTGTGQGTTYYDYETPTSDQTSSVSWTGTGTSTRYYQIAKIEVCS